MGRIKKSVEIVDEKQQFVEEFSTGKSESRIRKSLKMKRWKDLRTGYHVVFMFPMAISSGLVVIMIFPTKSETSSICKN